MIWTIYIVFITHERIPILNSRHYYFDDNIYCYLRKNAS